MSPPLRSEAITAGLLRRWPLPKIDDGGTKDTRGAVLVIAGSASMPGAAILAATGALRAGAGKLQIATARSLAGVVAGQVPEALVIGLPETASGGIGPRAARELAKRAEAVDAVLVGPGMVDPQATISLTLALLERVARTPLVLDAGALEAASKEPAAFATAKAKLAMTPHAKEMANMLGLRPGEVNRDAAAIAVRAARVLHGVVALKGAQTHIADATGRLLCNRSAGNAGLGTSGSGDTLSGVIVGLAARGADLLQATSWGVFLHARAGDVLAKKIGPVGFLARELLAEVPRELARLSR
jgi:ADP-dependent NAD(P)H-hydrate dehydratase